MFTAGWTFTLDQTGMATVHVIYAPLWGAAVAEMKAPSGENTKLKLSPFKAWSGSVCSPTCYAYCQEFLPG